jgi:hypothetical protein
MIGIHIQDMVFPLESGKRNPPTICHNHARACIWIWRALACCGGRWPKCWTNQYEFTPVVFLSFTPSCGLFGRTPNNASTMSLQSYGFMWPVTAYPSTRRPKSMETSSNVIVISSQGRWKLCVSGFYRSTSAVKAALSIFGSLVLINVARGRKPDRRMKGVYLSSHGRGVWVRGRKGFKT